MADKFFQVFLGNFGSGKSELALNSALNLPSDKDTVFVDLDVINPYFRSSDRKQELVDRGIKVITPLLLDADIEIITLPPEIYSVFTAPADHVIFDVGGDHNGATAIGQYYPYFSKIPADNLRVWLVVNACRPLSATTDKVVNMLKAIEQASRLRITGLINNTNLATEATAEDLIFGYEIIKQASIMSGVPVSFTSGRADVLEDFSRAVLEQGLDQRYIGELWPIERLMHRDWESFIKHGV